MQHGDYSNYIFHSFDNWGLIAIRHSLFFSRFLPWRDGQIGEKKFGIFAIDFRHFAIDFRLNGETFLAISAI